jgi:hypothetical protein
MQDPGMLRILADDFDREFHTAYVAAKTAGFQT